MSTPDNGGRVSLNNEEAVLHHHWRPDSTKKVWLAIGRLEADDGKIEVKIYPEHRRKIQLAGYDILWDVAGEIPDVDVFVRLVENENGRRRIAAVLKRGTEDDWLEVKPKGGHWSDMIPDDKYAPGFS